MRSDRGPQDPALDLQNNLSWAVIFEKKVMASGPLQDNTGMIWVCADSQQPHRVWPFFDPRHTRFGIPVDTILTISLSKGDREELERNRNAFADAPRRFGKRDDLVRHADLRRTLGQNDGRLRETESVPLPRRQSPQRSAGCLRHAGKRKVLTPLHLDRGQRERSLFQEDPNLTSLSGRVGHDPDEESQKDSKEGDSI